MRMRHLVAGLAVLTLIGSCASTPTYGPSNGSGVGYSEVALEDDRYRVTYRGGDSVTARDNALYRAAEITVARGYEWFRVTNNYGEQVRSSGPRTSVGIGGSTGSRGSGVGIGIGIGFPLGGNTPESTQTLEILLGSGQKPAGPEIYDARSILNSLRPS